MSRTKVLQEKALWLLRQAVSGPDDGTAPERAARTLRLLDHLLRELEALEGADVECDNNSFPGGQAAPGWLSDPRPAHGQGPGTPVTLWSDWHYGEVVDAAEVAGCNAYSPRIAQRRAERLVQSLLAVCFDQMRHPHYPGLVVCLGGDLISGEAICDEITHSNAMRLAPMLLDVQRILAAALRELAGAFPAVHVVCVVGNHGRSTRAPRHKQLVLSNHEWLLYTQLAEQFAGDPRVTFQIPRTAEAPFTLHGHRFCLTHGDFLGLRPQDGLLTLAQQLRRGEARIQLSEGALGRGFDTLLIGHWHSYLPLAPQLIANGSLKGYDEYARLRLRALYEPAQQALFFVRPPVGLSLVTPLLVDDPVFSEAAKCVEAEPQRPQRSWFW